MPTQTLDTNTSRVTEQLTDMVLAPLNTTLSKLEGVFPGIREQAKETIDPGKLRTMLHAEFEQLITTSMQELIEKSPTDALLILKKLKSLGQSFGSVEIAEAKELMGKRMVGPDATIFEGRDLGEIPALPENIMEILNSRCELSNNGKTVAQTHYLVLVPASIDGEPLTINSLRELAAVVEKGKAPDFHTFYNNKFYEIEACAKEPLKNSTWVLEYETVAPIPEIKPGEWESMYRWPRILKEENLPNYRTANLLEHIGVLALTALETGERIYPKLLGLCRERSVSGAQSYAGKFSAHGLVVGDDAICDILGYSDVGRAIVRKFNT